VLKNIIHVPAEILSRDIILYIFLYSLFGIIFPSTKEKNPQVSYWYAAMIVVTVAIIAVYAF